jgi:succinate dehydrogenase/fumarate reductase flavoprotein subunit
MDRGSEFECGFKTNMDAQVLSTNDVLIPGLHAAGLTGLFYHEYPPATSALRSLTFGPIAGTAIAKSCEQVICGEFVSW